MKSVTRNVALLRRTHCQYVHGQGFIDHGMPPELPASACGDKNCLPETGAVDGSVHVLKPPSGIGEMNMIWLAPESAWAPTVFGKGNRLAWSADHLSKAGWEYVGTLDSKHSKPTKVKRSPLAALVRERDSR